MLTATDIGHIQSSWKLIADNTSVEFLGAQVSGSKRRHETCMAWFLHAFTTRFFDVHPLSKPLFPEGLEKCILGLLSAIIEHIHDDKTVHGMLCEVALRHSERGVRPIEYGVVGDVLFWCIRLCIGTDAYAPAVQSAWTKFFSMILQIVVPVAVSVQGQEPEIERNKYKTDVTVSCGEYY